MSTREVAQTLDHLFRRQSGQMVAYLTRFFGPDHLDLAEAVVQEALLKAVQAWPLQGIPDNPQAWILRAAKNSAIDHIRKAKDIPHEDEILESLTEATPGDEGTFANELRDDQLKLMFICCHPSLTREARIALTLKTICGFSVPEIARAFLSKEETIAQRIVRAKQKIGELKLQFEVPGPNEVGGRMESVLEVLYLLFNEGYLATAGEALIRRDLCEEAIFRTTELARHRLGARPETYALLALMHFQVSRFDARLDTRGELLLLEEQDRSLWDQSQIQFGMKYLSASARGEELSKYHLEAGIASCHALAPSFEQTEWDKILSFYDILLLHERSAVVALNRTVAYAFVHGWGEGLKEIEKIQSLEAYYLLHATKAELHRRNGDLRSAKANYEKALTLVGTEPERRLIQKRLAALG